MLNHKVETTVAAMAESIEVFEASVDYVTIDEIAALRCLLLEQIAAIKERVESEPSDSEKAGKMRGALKYKRLFLQRVIPVHAKLIREKKEEGKAIYAAGLERRQQRQLEKEAREQEKALRKEARKQEIALQPELYSDQGRVRKLEREVKFLRSALALTMRSALDGDSEIREVMKIAYFAISGLDEHFPQDERNAQSQELKEWFEGNLPKMK
jgi:hypothetical protein